MQRVFDERKEGGKIIEKIVESFEFIKTRKKEDPSKRRNFKLRQNSNYISYTMKQHRRNCFFFFFPPPLEHQTYKEKEEIAGRKKEKGKA